AFPDGDALIDEDRLQRYVANWGDWLAQRSLDENILGASVVVESAPDTGLRLNRLVASQRVADRSEEHTSELQSRFHLLCRLLLYPATLAHTLFPYTPLFRSGLPRWGCPHR